MLDMPSIADHMRVVSQTYRKQVKDMTKKEIFAAQMQQAQNAIAQTQLKAADLLNQATKKIKTLRWIIATEAAVIIGGLSAVIYRAYT